MVCDWIYAILFESAAARQVLEAFNSSFPGFQIDGLMTSRLEVQLYNLSRVLVRVTSSACEHVWGRVFQPCIIRQFQLLSDARVAEVKIKNKGPKNKTLYRTGLRCLCGLPAQQ